MKDILKKTDAEIAKDIAEKREALRAWRFNLQGSKVKNVKEGKAMRKEIARMLTAISSRKAE